MLAECETYPPDDDVPITTGIETTKLGEIESTSAGIVETTAIQSAQHPPQTARTKKKKQKSTDKGKL